ncbi:MAG: hypothetical protein OXG30_10430 [bacterium]|nr:hypothetical protein [bacterium]
MPGGIGANIALALIAAIGGVWIDRRWQLLNRQQQRRRRLGVRIRVAGGDIGDRRMPKMWLHATPIVINDGQIDPELRGRIGPTSTIRLLHAKGSNPPISGVMTNLLSAPVTTVGERTITKSYPVIPTVDTADKFGDWMLDILHGVKNPDGFLPGGSKSCRKGRFGRIMGRLFPGHQACVHTSIGVVPNEPTVRFEMVKHPGIHRRQCVLSFIGHDGERYYARMGPRRANRLALAFKDQFELGLDLSYNRR